MFGNDLNITLRIMNLILDYENSQVGLNLTSEQSSTFLSVSSNNFLKFICKFLNFSPVHFYLCIESIDTA